MRCCSEVGFNLCVQLRVMHSAYSILICCLVLHHNTKLLEGLVGQCSRFHRFLFLVHDLSPLFCQWLGSRYVRSLLPWSCYPLVCVVGRARQVCLWSVLYSVDLRKKVGCTEQYRHWMELGSGWFGVCLVIRGRKNSMMEGLYICTPYMES